jgi:EAL domain-containing protein (putative c-di-GMP-specific phosphodiesterase class I)
LLELEITETLLMENVKRSSAVIEELKSIGVRLSIDDFGTGYSSLSYLKRFPLNSVKIDRSFVSDVTTSESDASIVRATVALAKSLELKIVAEGVETKEQMDFLTQHGCDELQGFLFNKPMPPREFLSFALASPTFLFSKKVSA